jgi:hypothetical protein
LKVGERSRSFISSRLSRPQDEYNDIGDAAKYPCIDYPKNRRSIDQNRVEGIPGVLE